MKQTAILVHTDNEAHLFHAIRQLLVNIHRSDAALAPTKGRILTP